VNKTVTRSPKRRNIALERAFLEIRNRFNIDQGEIAIRLGRKETYVSEVLNGRRTLSDKLIEKIYEVFQIKVETDVSESKSNCQEENKNLIALCTEKERTIRLLEERVMDQKTRLEEKEKTIQSLRETIDKMTLQGGDTKRAGYG
jgi:transcriptional regulator with XRE-family HTH domain